MGQINSRHHNTESILRSSSSTAIPESEIVVDNEARATQAQTDDEVATTTIFTPKPSRRASMGRSLRSLVTNKSTSTARGRVDSNVSSTESRSSRRRWRTSRRWSKAPEELNGSAELPQRVVAPVSENTSEESEGTAMVTPSDAKGKQKEEDVGPEPNEIGIPTIIDRPPTPVAASGSSRAVTSDLKGLDEGMSMSVDMSTSDQGYDAHLRPNVSLENADVVIPQTTQDELTPGPPLPAPTNTSDTQQNTPPSRQFPPPGTLVVVQGVVHTTDVPRMHDVSRPSRPSTPRPSSIPTPRIAPRRASSTPRPHTQMGETPAATSARNRLSALIPRPTTRPDTIVDDSDALASSTLAVDNELDSEPPSLFSDTPGSGDTTPTSTESDPPAASEVDTRPPPALSPSSIDVLGTLLSVAAAATAASLLTGSSDPIFASGLNPANVNGNSPPSQPTPQVQRPTSPTPIAGLGGLGSLSSTLGLSSPTPRSAPTALNSHGSGRDRIRQAWTNFRERLGMRSSNNAASYNSQSEGQGRTRPDGTPMDTRDLMLAEMARAFNLGLGLNGDSTTDSTARESSDVHQETTEPPTTSIITQERTETPAPAEDSFEQFLIDLQADLRVALSLQESPANQLPSYTPDLLSETVAQPSTEEPISIPEHRSTTPSPLPRSSSDLDAEDSTRRSEVEPEPVIDEDSGANTGMSEVPELLHVRQSLPRVSTTTRSRTERTPGGGINWWRSYRFAPVTAPNVHGLSNTLNTTNVASSPLSSNPPSELDSQPRASTSSSIPPPSSSPASQSPTIQSAAPAATDNRPSIVVPVIVVGLQSVNMNRRRNQAPSLGDDGDVPAAEHNEPDSPAIPDDLNIESLPGDGGSPGTPRGRAWHSRAADALRNLRPGRRASQIPIHDSLGSSTFLIYVIGGYYPPDHGLITGVDALDSFEALWELAELLGQVKPQTVSKEDIEKSGLEIVKPTVLEKYQKEGKVASNCMERCLICLDEYEPEVDLRLLKCRHAFHKHCVDQWLQTGKNNCPACRTQGVSTNDEPEAAPTTTV